MSQSGIEWTDWTLNPVKGKCPVACPYCYARRMYDDFKWNPEIRFVPSVFNELPKKPVRVFVGSTIELFLFDDWMEFILNRCQDFPQHTFMFLTKKPENLPRWSPFPENCWVGITLTKPAPDALLALDEVEARLRFISIEPMLARFPEWDFSDMPVDWLIIGALTGKKAEIMELAKKYPELTPMPWGKKWTLQPKIEWVEEIVRAADKAGIPVFIKNNLLAELPMSIKCKLLLHGVYKLRQEMPG